jgi:hypothetical protein
MNTTVVQLSLNRNVSAPFKITFIVQLALSFIQSILPRHSLPFSYTFYVEIIHFNRSFTSKGFHNTNIVFRRKNEPGTIHVAFSPKQFLLERIPTKADIAKCIFQRASALVGYLPV